MLYHVLKRHFFSGSTTLPVTWLTIVTAVLHLLPESQAVVQLVAPPTAAKNETITSPQAAQAAPTKTGKR